MKQGEVIGEYLITTKPTNANGGKCLWAFASQDGEEFFIKQFLDPKYPLDSSPGGAASKRLRRQDCAAFEQRHLHVMQRLRSNTVGGGNIVVAEAFFRDGATYYKVTKRIDASSLKSLRSLTEHQKAVVLRTLGLSLQQLHRIGVVHGDLKPDNVLVQKRPGDLYTAKLIDFDDSYLTGQPPEPTAVAGDEHYGAPEWHAYIQEESASDGSELTTAVDMFALGLMLHEYLTGELPGYPEEFPSPGEAVKAGHKLSPDSQLHPEIHRLVLRLTDASPQRRPGIEDFLGAIDDESQLKLSSTYATTVPPFRATVQPGRGTGRLQIRMGPGTGLKPPARSAEDRPRPVSAVTEGEAALAAADEDERPSRPAPRSSRLRFHFDS